MPKLECPFEKDENYKVIPKIKEEYKWIFTDEAIAVEKLDGTNVSVQVLNRRPSAIMNRLNPIDIWQKGNARFLSGVVNSIEKSYFIPTLLIDNIYFGELIGEKIQGNPYQLNGTLWLPFDNIMEKYRYKFWNGFVKENTGKTDEEIFNSVSELFKGLWSLCKRSRGIIFEQPIADTTFTGSAAEGIVFYRKGSETDYIKCCKLRRDMFDWFRGKQHKGKIE